MLPSLLIYLICHFQHSHPQASERRRAQACPEGSGSKVGSCYPNHCSTLHFRHSQPQAACPEGSSSKVGSLCLSAISVQDGASGGETHTPASPAITVIVSAAIAAGAVAASEVQH